jgi:hypothetical protein
MVHNLAAGIEHLEGHTLYVSTSFYTQQKQNIHHPGYTGTPNTFKSVTTTTTMTITTMMTTTTKTPTTPTPLIFHLPHMCECTHMHAYRERDILDIPWLQNLVTVTKGF